MNCSGEESTASVQKHALKGLATLGVDIKFITRLVRATTVPTGQTEVTLSDESELIADLYVPTYTQLIVNSLRISQQEEFRHR